MRRALGLVCLVVVRSAVLGGQGPTALAQQPASAFLTVLDQNGVPVTNLEASQVSMTIDGVACTPVTLQPINWLMKLTVLIDNGASSPDALVPTSLAVAPNTRLESSTVWASSLPDLREGLRRFLFEVPEGVETALVTLAPQPRWVVRPTAERQDFWRGIDLVVPDRGAARFLEGLAEAADRIDRGPTDAFSTIMIVTTNNPDGSGGDWQRMFNRLREQLTRRPVTVHALVLSVSEQRSTETAAGSTVVGGTSPAAISSVSSRVGLALKTSGSLQTQVGLALTQDTGGRYEAIALANKLLTLLPEFGRQIARSHALQSNQYRISCEGSTPAAGQVSVFTTYPGARNVLLSRDGHIP